MSGGDDEKVEPLRPRAFAHATEVALIFVGPADTEWTADRNLINDDIVDPFER